MREFLIASTGFLYLFAVNLFLYFRTKPHQRRAFVLIAGLFAVLYWIWVIWLINR